MSCLSYVKNQISKLYHYVNPIKHSGENNDVDMYFNETPVFPNEFARTMTRIRKMQENSVIPADRTKELEAVGWKVRIRHCRYFSIVAGLLAKGKTLTVKTPYLTKQEFLTAIAADELTNQELKNAYSKFVSTRGGKTECKLVSPEGKEYTSKIGCAFADDYSRRTGRAYAVEKAYQEFLKEQA